MKRQAAIFCAVVLAFLGCGKTSVDRALESDARGYFCPSCQARFYTAFDVIANVCPQCKTNDILEVVGYVCAGGHVTLAPRGRGVRCGQCG